jgi:hypothetical protein
MESAHGKEFKRAFCSYNYYEYSFGCLLDHSIVFVHFVEAEPTRDIVYQNSCGGFSTIEVVQAIKFLLSSGILKFRKNQSACQFRLRGI